MYIKIDKKLIKLEESSLQNEDVSEKTLDKWIVNNPNVFGEELLILDEEHSPVGTKESIDILAIDKQGNLVIIENKTPLKDKGAIIQAIKYVSYCMKYDMEKIKNIYTMYKKKGKLNVKKNIIAYNEEDDLFDSFFKRLDDSQKQIHLNKELNQRIILVAPDFSNEVITTVNWLIAKGLDIKCFKVKIYKHNNNDVFVSFDSYIPGKGSEEYIVGVKNKNIQNRAYELYYRFWTDLKHKLSKKDSTLFKEFLKIKKLYTRHLTIVDPDIKKSFRIGFGLDQKLSICFVVVYLENMHEKMSLSTFLNKNKTSIKEELKKKDSFLVWDNKESNTGYVLVYKKFDLNNIQQWNSVQKWMMEAIVDLKRVFLKYYKEYKKTTKTS